MLVCNCTLPYTNPNACKSCSRWLEYHKDDKLYDPNFGTAVPSDFSTYTKTKRTTTTVKKYDKKGKYKGENIIITEEEIFDKINYNLDNKITDSNASGISFSCGVTSPEVQNTATSKENPFTYTTSVASGANNSVNFTNENPASSK